MGGSAACTTRSVGEAGREGWGLRGSASATAPSADDRLVDERASGFGAVTRAACRQRVDRTGGPAACISRAGEPLHPSSGREKGGTLPQTDQTIQYALKHFNQCGRDTLERTPRSWDPYLARRRPGFISPPTESLVCLLQSNLPSSWD